MAFDMDQSRERPAPIDPSSNEPGTPTASPIDTLRRSLESPCAVFASPRRSIVYSDRFIPSRATNSRLDFSVLDRERAAHESPVQQEREDANHAYRNMLRQTLLGSPVPSPTDKPALNSEALRSPVAPGNKMFRFISGDRHTPAAGSAPQSPFQTSPGGADVITPYAGASASPRRVPRKIPRGPFKVLDAPSLQDDFYLNLVDWSSQNVLAVGLGSCVYLWSACTCKVTKLVDLASTNDTVCSVAWSQRGTYLSVGTTHGDTRIFDVSKLKQIRNMHGHRARVGTMAWNSHLLSTGSRDRNVLQRDVRAQEAMVQKCSAHRSEVCGLKWSPDNRQLASGGNDNQLCIWSLNSSSPMMKFSEHTAAVKAIAWSPHQHGLLASGGGTADRCIRFWNTATNFKLNTIDTGSQVCNLAWSKNVNEIVSTHGYSQNQIIVWKYPTMSKLATLTGHTLRVLYLAMSPDGQTIVTGAGDETLRFWNVFPGPKPHTSTSRNATAVTATMRTHIR